MFEHRTKPLLPRPKFFARLRRCAALAVGLIAVSLGIGMLGYHVLESMSWVDSFVNASMILSGMGPVGELKTSPGKIFAGCYALFSGVAFLTSIALVFAPIFHRFLHKFHLEISSKADREN